VRSTWLILLTGVVGFLPLVLRAQGTAEDYRRANSLRERFDQRVFRDRIRVHWLADNTHGWYRVGTGVDTHEYILFDAANGRRESAFDHAALADALSQAGITDVAADRLPLERLQLDMEKGEIRFRCEGRLWRFEWPAHDLSEIPRNESRANGRSWADAPKASRRTGAETTITFQNRTTEVVELFWLDERGERRGYGQLDPGGRRSQHTFAGHVWLVQGAKGQPLAVFEAEEEPLNAEIDGEAQPSPATLAPAPSNTPLPGISPDGRWQAWVEKHNLVLKEMQNGELGPLTAEGSSRDRYTAEAIHWSPDSRKLLALRTATPDVRKVHLIESSPKDQLQPKLHTFEYAKPGDPIPQSKPRLFDVPGRREIPVDDALFSNPWSLGEVHWAPDSTEVQFLYNQRGHQVLRVIAVESTSGDVRAVVDEQSATFIDYAGKLFLHRLDDTGELIWMSERDGWNHLYLYDARKGAVKNQITRGDWVVRGVEHVDSERRQVFFRAGGIMPDQDPYHVHYARINFDGSELVVLTKGDGTHSAQFSPDRRFLVDTWSRVDQPPVTELRRVKDGELVCELERSDLEALRASGWQTPERFVAKGRDGLTDIYGVLFRPTNFDSGKSYPVIEQIYAGPQDSHVPKAFRPFHGAQAMAELGFVVVAIDGMGTSNRSKRFHDVCWKNLADAGFLDRIPWLKAASARYPQLDLTRVGIYGGSAGGQNALGALLFHGDFYKVAVADCGCHDNRMDKIWWNELWMGWPVGPHYAEQSNATQAHRLEGKLLLIVGELDRNVDPASTLQVVNALVKADKDFELLVMPATGHGAAETPYASRRRMDFFVRHLLGVEPRL
jgi:dipeptidyl-peptidase 4